MTEPQTPATEAGRLDHDEAWNDFAESEYHMTHDSEREGCGGCAAILAIEAEARADERQRIAQENAERLLAIPAIRAIVERLADDLRAILAEPSR